MYKQIMNLEDVHYDTMLFTFLQCLQKLEKPVPTSPC